MLRQGLRLLLEEAGVTVLAETGEAGEVVSLMEASPAAVLVLDVSIGDPGSVELTSRVRRQSPGVQVLALVTPPRRQLMGRVLEIGAAGCVLVSSPFSELRRGVEAVAAGQ
ncbi:MAG: response regulator, partial [Phycisphaeraceae bacterium]